MKHYGIKPLVLVLLLAVVLSSCAVPAEQTPAPQESESTTTTTTSFEATTTTTTEPTTTTADTTTTTTTTTTTEATTTTSATTKATTTSKTTEKTTKPTTSKTTEKTTKLTTAKTTKITKNSTTSHSNTAKTSAVIDPTYPKGHSKYQANPPFEDKNSAPGKDKQRLLFNVWGEEVEFTFDAAMRHPQFDDELLWHYSGTTKNGTVVTCKVAAERNQIYEIDCDTGFDCVIVEESDAQECMDQFLREQGLLNEAKKFTLSSHSYTTKGSPFRAPTRVVDWTFGMKTEKEGDYFYVSIKSRNGKVYVNHIEAGHREVIDGQVRALPYCLGEGVSIITPRWKSE